MGYKDTNFLAKKANLIVKEIKNRFLFKISCTKMRVMSIF